LQEQLFNLQKENYELREFVQAVKRLRRLLLFKEQVPVAMIPAEVIAYSPSAWFRTIVVNKGRQDGVKKGMPVVTWEGVVGKVIKTSTDSSIILLIIDRNSSVDAMVQRNRRRGIFEGDGGPRCQLRYVPRTDDIKVGDFIVTSGLGGVFPKGLFLGKVVRVEKKKYGLFQEIEASPGVDFSRLEEVMVILRPEEESKG
jgi:rod shape-determining protein MreC